MTSYYAELWSLNPEILFLNHGSFGACPKAILQKQQEYSERFETEPVHFVLRELDGLLLKSKEALATFIGANAANLALVHNVTTAVNTVFKSYSWKEGDEVVITNHIYGACRIALHYVAERYKLRIHEVNIPFPLASSAEVTERICLAVSDKTRMLFIDHITSPTALRFPVEDLLKTLQNKPVDIFIDGAHAPGAIDLDLESLNVAFYTGNCHKWMCAPKGVGFLYVRPDKQDDIHPLSHSHFSGPGRSFSDRFHWGGTLDPTAMLCLQDVVGFIENTIDGGWNGMRNHNKNLALEARKIICETLKIPLPCPDDMITTMAAIPIGESKGNYKPGYNEIDELQQRLFENHRIEVPVYTWPDKRTRIVRPSGQIYNEREHYVKLAEILKTELSS